MQQWLIIWISHLRKQVNPFSFFIGQVLFCRNTLTAFFLERLKYQSLNHRRINGVFSRLGVGPWLPVHNWEKDQVIAQEIASESMQIVYKVEYKWLNLARAKEQKE
jgi:hypothetical protein